MIASTTSITLVAAGCISAAMIATMLRHLRVRGASQAVGSISSASVRRRLLRFAHRATVYVCAFAVSIAGLPLHAATYTWTPTATGTYSWIDSNWVPTGYPNAVGDVANLNIDIAGDQIVQLNRGITIGSLNIGDAVGTNRVTVATGTAGALILDALSGNALITKLNGANDVVSAGVLFNDNLTITNNSTGSLTFSGGIRSLVSDIIFDGTGPIIVNTASIATGGSFTKAGSGTTTLGIAGAWGGSTTVAGGTLALSVASAIPARSAVTVNSGAVLDYLNVNYALGSLSGGGDIQASTATTTTTLTLGALNTDTTFSGRFVAPATTSRMAITKNGSGTLTLAPTAASTYTGATIINGGALALDFSAGSLTSMLAATPVTISGGNLIVKGRNSGGAIDQTLGNLTIGATGGSIIMDPNGSALGTQLTFGTLTATTIGGTLLVVSPAGTTVRTSTTFGANSIYAPGRAVFSDGTNYDWLSKTGAAAPYTFIGLPQASYTPMPDYDGSTTGNFLLTSGVTPSASMTLVGNSFLGTLKIHAADGVPGTLDLDTYTMNLLQNGLLFSGPDAYTITASTGRLVVGNGSGAYDLNIHQYGTNAAGLTVNAQIIDNPSGAVSLVKAGPGLLTLGGANTFTGSIVVSGGTLSFSNLTGGGAGSLGMGIATAVTLHDGSTLRYTGSTSGSIAAGTTAGSHTFVLQGGLTTIDVTTSGVTMDLAGGVSGTGGLIKTGAGNLILNASTFTGIVSVDQGILRAVNLPDASPLTVAAGATYDIYGTAASQTDTIGSLAGAGTVTNSAANAKTLSVGGDNTSTTFSGNFDGVTLGNTFTKVGSGTMVISSAQNLWTNTKNINGGVLRFGSSTAFNVLGGVVVANAGAPAWWDLNGYSYTNNNSTSLTIYGSGSSALSQALITLGDATLTFGGNLTQNNNNNPQAALITASSNGAINLAVVSTFTINNSLSVPADEAELTISSAINGIGGFTKVGLGNLRITGGTNTSSGANAFNSGITWLDYRTDNTAKLGSGGVTMAGGTLILQGNASAATSQTIGTLAMTTATTSKITLANGVGQSLLLSFGNITRAASAGTLRLQLPSGIQSATNGAVTTQANDVNGLLTAALTVTDSTGTYFAMNSGGNVVPATTTLQDNLTLWGTGGNYSDVAGYTGSLDTETTIGSLRFNTASGASTVAIVSGGVLNIGSGGILQTANVTGGTSTISGGRLTSGTGNEFLFTVDSLTQRLDVTSTITGASIVTKTGDGTLRLGGYSTYTGATNLQAGTLQVIGGNAIGDASAISLSVSQSTIFELLNSEAIGGLSTGTLYSGTVAEVRLGGNDLTLTDSVSRAYSGIFTGSGNIIRNGTSGGGNWQILGVSGAAFTGNIVVNGGLMYLEASGNLGSASSLTLNKGAAFLFANNGGTRSATRMLDTSPITLNSADGSWSGQTILSGLSIRTDQTTAASETVGALNLASGGNYARLEATATGAITQLIADNVVRANNATLNIRGTNMSATTGARSQIRIGTTANETAFIATMVGGGSTTAGTKNISIVPYMFGEEYAAGTADTNMGNSLLTYVAGNGFRALNLSTEYFTFATKTTNQDNIRLSGTANVTGIAAQTINSLVVNNTNTVTNTQTVSGSGNLVVTSGAFLFTAVGATASTDMGVVLSGFSGITVGATNEYVFFVQRPTSVATAATMTATISSALTSAADITKSGRGTLILTTANTAGGGARKTTLNEGILQITSLGQIGGTTGGLVFAGGTLQLGSGYTGDLSTRTVTLLNGGGTLDTNGTDLLLAGSFATGSGNFTKSGAGTLTFAAGTGYTGSTAVQNGRLVVRGGANNRLTTGAGWVLGTGTLSGVLQLGDTVGGALNQTITDLSTSGTGTTNAIVGGAATVSTLTINQATTTTYGGIFGGAGANENNLAVVKTGLGTITFGGASTLTGGLTIRQGTVIGNVAGFLGDPTNVVTLGDTSGSADATLNVQGTFTYANPITIASGTSGAISILGGSTTGAPTLNGLITLNNNLIIGKLGTTGDFTLAGGTTGTGNLTISNIGTTGAIRFTTGTLNHAGSIVNSGYAAAITTIAGNITSNVTHLVQNSPTSALTLSGTTIAYTGATNVAAGTLNITGGTTGPLSTSALSVAGGATLNLLNGFGQAINLGGGTLNLGLGTGITTFGLEIGSPLNYDRILTSNAAMTANSIVFNLTGLTGVQAGTYELLTASGGLNNATYSIGSVSNFGGFLPTIVSGPTFVRLTLAELSGDVYWRGAYSNSWSTFSGFNTNFTTDLAGNVNATTTPSRLTRVIYSSSAAAGPTITTTLDANFTVAHLGFMANPAGVTSVTLNPGTPTTNTLTISPAVATDGIFVDDNAGAVTIAAPVVLGANQTWNVVGTGANGSSLRLSGGVTGTGNLIKDGAGILTLSGTNSYSGTTTVTGGVLTAASANAFSVASAHTIGAAGILRTGATSQALGSLAGAAGGIVENGSATATVLTVGADNTSTTFAGTIQNGSTTALGLTKVGIGTLTLSGMNSYTGTTTINAGALAITGTTNVGGATILAGGNLAGARGRLLTSTDTNLTSTQLSTGTNATSSGAIYQAGGTVRTTAADGTNLGVLLGGVAGGYGYYKLSEGTLTANRITLGGSGFANATGIFEQTGGTSTFNVWTVVGHNASNALIDLSGGTLNSAGSFALNHASNGYSVVNVRGTGVLNRTGASINLMQGNTGASNNVGILNLLSGGTIRTNSGGIVVGTVGTGNLAQANFNGGTIITNAASSTLINVTGAALTSTSGAFLYSGGLAIDTNNLNSTIPMALSAPTGMGLASIGLVSGGSGYISAPMIKITGGSGAGATAIANMVDDGNGLLRIGSITITNPGIGYQASDVLTFTFGDNSSVYTTQATLGAATFATNVSGGLIKTNAGTLTLGGSNTFTGPLRIDGGTIGAATFNSIGTAGPLGSGIATNAATHAASLVLNGGVLSYTGTTATTDRLFTLTAAGGEIQSNNATAANTITFTATTPMTYSGSGARTFTLGGVNTGVNAFNLQIVDASTDAVTLQKSGAGTWAVTNTTNSYTGGTNINAGVLQFNQGSLGTTGAITFTGTSTLRWNGHTQDLSGRLSFAPGVVGTIDTNGNNIVFAFGTGGAGTMAKTGAGSLTLNAAALQTGGFTLNSGTLNLGHAGALGSGTFTISGASTIDNTSGGPLTISTNPPQAWNADFTFTGSNALNLGTGDVTLGAARTVTVAANTLTVGGAIGGLFGFTKAGPGTLYLTGNSTFGAAAGSTITINGGGVLKIDSEANLGNVLNDVTFGAGNGTLHVTNGFNANAGKVFTIGANQATIQVDAGTMTINSALVGAANTTGGLIKTGNGTLALAAASTGYDVQGVGVNGATGVGFRVDAGTLLLQGNSNGVVGDANPNTMTIQLNGGNLSIQSDTANIARANLYISAPATLTADLATPGPGGSQAMGAGSGAALTMGLGSSTLAIVGGENVTSGIQVVQFGATTFLADPTFNIVNPSSGAITQLNLGAITGGTFTPTLTGNGRFTQTGVLTSTGGFTLAAGFSGLATLNQANVYTGVTTVNGGVLAFSTSGNLGNASATNRIQLGGGTLRYTATGALDITANRQITLTPGSTSTIDVASDLGTLRVTGGVVTSAAANLNKVGAGSLVISNAVNLNGGALNVADGTLTAGFSASGLGKLTVGSTGILQLIDSAATTLTLGGTAGALTLAGGARLAFELDSSGLSDSILVGGGGTAATSGGVITLDFTRLTNFGAGTYTLLQSAGGGLLQAGTTYALGNAPAGFNYVLNATDTAVTLQTSVLSNRYWTNSQSGGSWNTLTGGTLANFSTDLAGTTNAGARPGSADTVIFSATTITATAITTTLDAPFAIDSLQFNRQPSNVATVAINPGAGGAANNLTLNPVSPSNGINVGSQAGAVTISAPVVVGGPQTWFVDGTSPSSLVISGAVTFGAAVTKTGAGSLTLSGANSGSGPITLNAGTIVINNAGALGTGRFTIGAGTTINSTVATTLAADNPLTFNGSFTFTGGQTLTFGNGPVTMADNITISTTASTLTFGGVIDDGADSFQLTKAGTGGTLVLNGANTYGGGTVLNGGTLQIGHKTALGTGVLTVSASSTLRPGTELTASVGGPVANDIAMANTLTITGTNSLTMSGALTVTGAARTLTNNLTAPALLTLSGNVFLSEAGATAGRNLFISGTGNTRIDGVVSNGPTAGGWLVKTGTGTLTLGASNTHTSFFIIDQGIVTLAAGADQNIPSTFFYGQNNGVTTAGTFDLSSASATYASMIVQLNTASVATTLIGAGQSLNINGSVTIGTGLGALTTTSFAAIGAGTFNSASTGASTAFIVGGSTSTASMGNIATADFSGLAAMNVNYSGATSVITINPNNTSTTTPTSNSISGLKSTLKLAPVSSLRAATLNVGAGPTNAGAVDQYNSLILGSTSNVINVNTFNVGTGLRDLGHVMFGGATGTITIRALDGVGRTAMNIGTGTSQTDVDSSSGNLVDFTGHTADLLLSTLTIGNQARQTSIANTFGFSLGTLDATAVVVGANTQTANATPVDSTFTNTLSISGGTVTIGAGGLDIGSVSAASTGVDQIRGTVNISAGNVTIGNNATWGAAVRLGTVTIDTPAVTTSILNITGGSLTLGGDLLFGASTAARSVFNTFTLDGGTLDMGGHNFGVANLSSATVEFKSGTLSNVNQYFDGGPLATIRKISTGTLLLNTQNNFTGGVEVNAGVLRVSHGQALGDVATGTTTVNGGTLELLGNITTTAEPLVINVTSQVQLRNVSGNNVYSGPVQLNGVGAARIESLAGTLTFDVATGNAFSGSSVVFEGAGNFVVNDPLALGTNALTKQGAGTLALNAASTYTGITTISGGVLSAAVLADGGVDSSIGKSTNAAANLVFDGGTLRYTGATTTSTDRNFTIVTGKTAVFDVASSNAALILAGTSGTTDGGLTKTGAGALTLAAAFYGHVGTTTVAQGSLNSADGTELAGDVAVQSGAALSAGSNANGIHNDGVGTLAIGGNLALAAGSTLVLDFNNGFGTLPGTDWDLIRFSDFGSSLDLSGQDHAINLKLMSWRPDNLGYGVNNLDLQESTLSWLFVDTGTNGSISGLTYDGSGHVTNFNIDTSQVSAQSPFGGSFYVTQLDNDLYLNYSSVPEPGSLLLTSLAALGLAGYRRRRRRTPTIDAPSSSLAEASSLGDRSP